MTSPGLRASARADDLRAGTIHSRFAQTAAAYPSRTAVREHDGREWTYADLAGAVARVADLIQAQAPESEREPRIGLHLPHGVPMIVGQLGALAAGCCYVPLDPTYPDARLRLMARVAELDVVLTAPDDGHDWPATRLELAPGLLGQPGDGRGPLPVLGAVDPDRAAYILFTSGSTGRPKGVVHTHRTVLHGLANHVTNMEITAADQVTVLTSFSFDMAVSDLYGALLTGATAVPLDVRQLGVPALAGALCDAGATVFHATPTVFRLLAAQGRRAPTVRLAVLGGEPVLRHDVSTARSLFATDCVFVNGYGFTEASFVVQQQIRPGDPVGDSAVLPIGHPLAGYDVRVEDLDADGVGELVVESDALARGYVGDPEQTRARFSADGRVYRPGDRVRRLPDGRFTFAGRADNQVKVRGVRIELDEVQLAVERLPEVARAVVLVDEGGELVAHVQPAPTAELTEPGLRARLREDLPDAMIPARCHVIDDLPLTPTGKVDVRALTRPADTVAHTPVESTAQQLVLDAWVAAVGADPGGLDVAFFDAGGGSLALARLHQSLAARVAEAPSPAALLGAGTVRRMAALMVESSGAPGQDARARAAERAVRRRARTGRPA